MREIDGYESLVMAIIQQAVIDYKELEEDDLEWHRAKKYIYGNGYNDLSPFLRRTAMDDKFSVTYLRDKLDQINVRDLKYRGKGL